VPRVREKEKTHESSRVTKGKDGDPGTIGMWRKIGIENRILATPGWNPGHGKEGRADWWLPSSKKVQARTPLRKQPVTQENQHAF